MSVATQPRISRATPNSNDGLRSQGGWAWLAFAVAAVASVVTLLYFGRDLLFHFDEWIWVQHRRDPSIESLLEPYNGHLSVVPVAIYQLFLWVFGIANNVAFRVLVAVLHVAAIALVFVYLRRRIAAAAALVAATVLLFFGAGWQDLLWPFQIGFVLSVAAGVGAFLLLDAERGGTDRAAMVCIAVALASSSVGIPVAIGLAVDRVLRRDWRRWWVVGAPILLYAAWHATYGESFANRRGNWPATKDPTPIEVVRFAIEAAGATVGSLVGVGSAAGQVLLLPLVAVVILRWVRADTAQRSRVLALVAILMSFWIVLGISRVGIQPPTTSRYLYPAAVFVVLLLAECLRGVRVPTLAMAALVAVGVWSVVWNADLFAYGREYILRDVRQTRVELGAMDIGARGVDAEYEAQRLPVPPDVQTWISAFDDLGSPGATSSEIAAAPEAHRRRADGFLVHAAAVHLAAAGPPGGRAPTITSGGPGTADGESCVVVRPTGARVEVELPVGTPALRIEAPDGPVEVRLRNFADEYFTGADGWATVRTDETRGLRLPNVAAGPWTVGIDTAAKVRLCGVLEPPT